MPRTHFYPCWPLFARHLRPYSANGDSGSSREPEGEAITPKKLNQFLSGITHSGNAVGLLLTKRPARVADLSLYFLIGAVDVRAIFPMGVRVKRRSIDDETRE